MYLEKRKVTRDTDIDKLIRVCGTRIKTLQRLCNILDAGATLDGLFPLLISTRQFALTLLRSHRAV